MTLGRFCAATLHHAARFGAEDLATDIAIVDCASRLPVDRGLPLSPCCITIRVHSARLYGLHVRRSGLAAWRVQ